MKRILIIIGFILSLSLNAFATESMVYGPMPTAKDAPADGEAFTWDSTSGIGEWESFPAVATTPTKADDNTADDTVMCTDGATGDGIQQCTDGTLPGDLTVADILAVNETTHRVLIDGLVQNGQFSNGNTTGWTLTTGWAAASSAMQKTAGNSNVLSQTIPIVAGETYVVIHELQPSAGGLTVSIGGTAGTQRTTTGHFGEEIVAGSSNSQIIFTPTSDFAGYVDFVMVFNTESKGIGVVCTPRAGTGIDQTWNGMGCAEFYGVVWDTDTYTASNTIYSEKKIIATSNVGDVPTAATNVYAQTRFEPPSGTFSFNATSGNIENFHNSVVFNSGGTAHTIPYITGSSMSFAIGDADAATYTIKRMAGFAVDDSALPRGGTYNITEQLTGVYAGNVTDFSGTIANVAGVWAQEQTEVDATNKYSIAGGAGDAVTIAAANFSCSGNEIVLTSIDNPYVNGDAVTVSGNGCNILAPATNFYVCNADADSFQLSATDANCLNVATLADGDPAITITRAVKPPTMTVGNTGLITTRDGCMWKDGGNTADCTVTTKITAVAALNSTPLIIAPATAGAWIEPISFVLILDYTDDFFDDAVADGDLVIQYATSNTAVAAAIEADGFIDSAADIVRYLAPTGITYPAITDDVLAVDGEAIEIINNGAAFTNGNSSLIIKATFRVHKLGL